MRKYNFGPCLYRGNLDEDIIEHILEIGKKQQKKFNSELIGKIEDEFVFDEESKTIVNKYIEKYIQDYMSKISSEKNLNQVATKLKMRNVWINFQKKNEYNPPHYHGGHITFVIYLEVPNQIKLEKPKRPSNPHGSITFCFGSDSNFISENEFEVFINKLLLPTTEHTILPNKGDFFIFPSYLIHYVESFESENVTRVSLSGNYNIVKNMI